MQAIKNQQTLRVRVSEASHPASGVRMLRLQSETGQPLPTFTPGAHIGVSVHLNGRQDWRQYSLIELAYGAGSTAAPQSYLIAIRLDERGRGGSRFMHEALSVGDIIDITAPRNDFPLRDTGKRVFLVAGGIGVTPLATMAAACRFHGREVKMVYAGRDRAGMALIDELHTLLGERLTVHTDKEVGAPIDIQALFDQFDGDDDIHICGPTPLLDAILAEAQRRNWARAKLNFELFAAPAAATADSAFDVVLACGNRTLHVPADKSILDVLVEAGCDPLFDCKRGECGVCATTVIEGEIDHRDYVLTERERATSKVMYPCVSRSKSAVLVLDV
ncbi:PDR/VanB family oxidoreductase [Pseudomonas sp. L13]|uniref:PDR/VanB family oxidoreductase n=1 Tax=Pseudomonas sp. L13 TaxID=343985 RepID=UPI00137A20D1|nr:PDR/VanB family oxidoreductase [Pseudomonas sp. L13]NCE89423.1 oxidoreductase [Pseudomonas sp. L13]